MTMIDYTLLIQESRRVTMTRHVDVFGWVDSSLVMYRQYLTRLE